MRTNEKIIVCVSIFIFGFFLYGCSESSEQYFDKLVKKGDVHFLRGDYRSALNVWLEAEKIKQDDVNILKKIGKTYMRLLETQKAEEGFVKVLQLQPEAWDIWLELGRIRLISLDVEAATEICQEILKNRPADIGGLILRADIEAIKGNLYEAELDYKLAISYNPINQLARARLCICLNGQHKYDEALETYKKLSELNPQEPEILLQMASYLKLTEQSSRAETLYQKLVDNHPEEISFRIALAEFYVGTEQVKKASGVLEKTIQIVPENKFVRKMLIKVFLADGQVDKAGKILYKIHYSKNVDIEYEMLKGEYHLMVQEPGLAVTNFYTVAEIDPEFSVAHYLLGLSYLAGGQNQLGYQSLVKALALDNDFSDAELALADYYYKSREYDLSLEHALRIANREPENYRAHLVTGNILIAKGRYEEAIGYLNVARKINPDSIFPEFFLGMASELSGETEEALKIYEAIIVDHLNFNSINQSYTNLLMKMGRHKLAIQHFEDVLTMVPDDGQIHFIIGQIHKAVSDLDKAVASFEKAILADSKIEAAYFELARIYEQKNKISEQKAVFKNAIENNGEFSAAYVALAGIYLKEGKPEKAIETLRHAYKMNRDDPQLANNLAALYLEHGVEMNVAFGLAQKAYEKLQESPAVADTLGLAYYKKGLVRQAEWYIREALRLGGWEAGKPGGRETGRQGIFGDSDQEDGEISELKILKARKQDKHWAIVRYHLGLVLRSKGDDMGAKASLEKALEVGLDGNFRKDAERVLKIIFSGKEEKT